MIKGIDVGIWVADEPIVALTDPTGPCIWWGLHRLWTLRCQKAVQWMEVDTLTVVMSLGVTFAEAQVWFRNTGQAEVAKMVARMSS